MRKNRILAYLAGLCQAASAALLASAVIVPAMRIQSILGCIVSALIGVVCIIMLGDKE